MSAIVQGAFTVLCAVSALLIGIAYLVDRYFKRRRTYLPPPVQDSRCSMTYFRNSMENK